MIDVSAAKVLGPTRRPGGLPRKYRRAVHDRRDRLGRRLLTGRAPDVATRARGPAPPAHARGRVQLRARGTGRRAPRRRGRIGGPGDLIFKPRDQWHTFWNAGDEPARLLEIIAPAGFEGFFRELVALGGAIEAKPEALAELSGRYGLEMKPETRPRPAPALRPCSGRDAHARSDRRAGTIDPRVTTPPRRRSRARSTRSGQIPEPAGRDQHAREWPGSPRACGASSRGRDGRPTTRGRARSTCRPRSSLRAAARPASARCAPPTGRGSSRFR